jgi:2-amino-4-hydroxy-6-hydroxymethyldihydropteridine diphosphokinase
VTGSGAVVYVGLGSNLGDRLATLRSAVELLRGGGVAGARLVRCSPVFETRPLGPSLGAYMNAVVELRCTCAPMELLAGLQALELRHGRVRRARWEARTLDLDVLVWTDERGVLELDAPGLRLPHPELARRDFVLAPLAALAPYLRPHGGPNVAQLLAGLGADERTILAQVDEVLC